MLASERMDRKELERNMEGRYARNREKLGAGFITLFTRKRLVDIVVTCPANVYIV